MLHTLISIVGVLITIVLVVGIHELGHFLAAKLMGIKVLRFSIGFGKPLLAWHDKSGTEYTLAAIPLGGYVKMLDAEEETVLPSEHHRTFNYQPIYKKFAVIAAGPFFNFLFAFGIYWLLFMVGFVSIAPIIGKVAPHSIAEQAGLRPQQEILRIDGKDSHGWMSIIVDLLARAGETSQLSMTLKNPDLKTPKDININLSQWHMDDLRPDPLTSLGITPYEPTISNIIGKLSAGGPAAKAGLLPGDTIITINKQKTSDWEQVVNTFKNHPNETLNFTIKRHQKILLIPVNIGSKKEFFAKKLGFLGMSPAFEWPQELLRNNQYGFLDAANHAWQDVVLFTKMNIIVFGKMLTGKISLASLRGQITIFESAGTALNNGLMPFLSFLAFLSISIGVVNIIPIPGLDGGHLLFQLIEYVMQRPLSNRLQDLLSRLGLITLLLLMMRALMNDILRL